MLIWLKKKLTISKILAFLGLILIATIAHVAESYEEIYGKRDVIRSLEDWFYDVKYAKISEEDLDYFLDISFDSKGRLYKRVDQVNYIVLGEYSNNFLEYVRLHFRQASEWTGVKVEENNDFENINYIVVFGTDYSLTPKVIGDIDKRSYEDDNCHITIVLSDENTIEASVLWLSADTGDVEIRNCFKQYFYRGYGLLGKIEGLKSTLDIEKVDENASELNRSAIKIMYKSDIKSGMEKDEVFELVTNAPYVRASINKKTPQKFAAFYR